MIEFVFGQSRNSKSTLVVDRIKKALDCGKKVILIAPEQQALLWDMRAAAELPPSAALSLEVVSFTRLADSLFRKYGGSAKNYITDAKKALVMWNAIVSVKESLTVYGIGREDRYVPLLLKAVSEAKLYSSTPEKLMEASEALLAEGREEALAHRLHDLSLIWAAYDNMLHLCYSDPEEIPDAVCELLDRQNCFDGCAVFIDSFYTLTPKEKNIVRRIFRDADDTLVTFALAANDRDGIHTEHVRAFKNSLAIMAARAGMEVKITDAGDADMLPAFRYLSGDLWLHTAAPFEGDTSCIKILTCGDRHDEAGVCAARIWELVRGGARFSDIAVVAADMSKLEGICDVQLSAMGIPVYASLKSELLNQNVLRLLLSAVRVAASGWRREDVIACAKTGLTGLSPDCCDALEKYADKWRLRGKSAFCADGWSMNPDGYTEEISDWGRELLCLSNKAREELIPPLSEFCSSLCGTVRDACRAAYKLLLDFNVYEAIAEEAKSLRQSGDGAGAQEKEQVWSAVCEILDTMVSAAGDTPVDPARFAGLLRRTAETIEIGTIPSGLDRVVLAGAGSARLDGVRHMIILGAIEGEFPASPGDNGFFCERDKKLLEPLGIELSPGIDTRQSEELFRFHAAVTAPSETLTVIIPSRDSDGVKRPSSAALRIMKLFPGAEIIKNAHENVLFMLQSKAAAQYYLPALRGTEYEKAVMAAANINDEKTNGLFSTREYVSRQTADGIFGAGMKLTQSRLEAFKDCPQSYYCKYILRLDDGEEVRVSPSDVGNFVHKILEKFLSEAARKNLSFPLDPAYAEKRAQELIDEYIKSVSPASAGKRLDYLFGRISRSLMLYIKSISDEFAQSSFRPYGFELPVGFDDSLPPLEIPLGDGTSMSMRGIVDRLDVYYGIDKVYVRVADYKTGAKDFKLDEVLEGRNVQLLLYLFSVCGCPPCDFREKLAPGGMEIVPAGAVYFSARPGEASSGVPVDSDRAAEIALSAIQRKGIVLRDDGIIHAMEQDGAGKYIPASYNKDGSLSSRSVTADRAEMDEIRDGLCEALRATGIDMKTGRASAAPVEHGGRLPCDYCKMRPVCRFDERSGEDE